MTSKDLFGEALVDHFEGRIYPLSMERDDGYIDEQDMSFYFKEYDQFTESERKALEYVKGRVLDIGVGAGRTALYLQKRGVEVVGIDVSENALDLCRRRGVKKLVNMSACDLTFKKNSFSTAIAFFNNLGLCGSLDGVAKMMERLHGIIKDGGVFLAETVNPIDTDRRVHLTYHKSNIARGRPPGQVTLRERYRGRKGAWWDLMLVTPDEMRTLCSRTGWKIEQVCNGGYMQVYVLRKA